MTTAAELREEAEALDPARLKERLDDALFVLGMVDKNNRIDAGEKGKAWSGRFVADEVRRVLAGAEPCDVARKALESIADLPGGTIVSVLTMAKEIAREALSSLASRPAAVDARGAGPHQHAPTAAFPEPSSNSGLAGSPKENSQEWFQQQADQVARTIAGLPPFMKDNMDVSTATLPVPNQAPAIDIDSMVTRFLAWELPSDFAPDGGIIFDSGYGHRLLRPTGTK